MSDITKVDAMDDGKKNSPVTVATEEESTVMMNSANKTCVWNDQQFTDGDHVCSGGTVYECSFGKWIKTPTGC
jgi:hypothetical protein